MQEKKNDSMADPGGEMADIQKDDQLRFDAEVEALQRLRVDVENRRIDMNEYLAENDDYQKLREVTEAAKEKLVAYDIKVREMALEYYEMYDSKTIHPAIKIAVRQDVVVSDEVKQLEYVIQNQTLHGALKINNTIFNKVVKSMPETARPPFVSIVEKNTVKIATDLSKFISEGK